MPIYAYTCDACKTEFDATRNVEDRDRFTPCPKCHSGKLIRIFTPPNLSGLPTRGSASTYKAPGDIYNAPPIAEERKRGKKDREE